MPSNKYQGLPHSELPVPKRIPDMRSLSIHWGSFTAYVIYVAATQNTLLYLSVGYNWREEGNGTIKVFAC